MKDKDLKFKKKKKKKKKKGFTLIELLAVVIILGLLMAIAIPSVTRYIETSRKKTYIQTLSAYADGISKMVASGDVSGFYDENLVYYIPQNCIDLEKGGLTSPYGDWNFAYILISVNNGNPKYYAYAKDVKGFGVEGIEISKLKASDIKQTNIKKEDLITIDGKNTVSVVSDSCNFVNPDKKVVGAMQPADSCFTITSAGVITDWHVKDDDFDIDTNSPCYSSSLVIPATINGITVKSIGYYAMSNSQLTSINIPNTVTFIDIGAFSTNKLTSITLPASVTTVDMLAFGFNQLTSVKINNPSATIGSLAFCENPSLTINNIIGAPASYNYMTSCVH